MNRVLVLSIICCLNSLSCFSQKNVLTEDKFLIVLDIQEYYTNGKLPENTSQRLIDSVNYVIGHTNPDNVIYIKCIHRLLNLSLSIPFIYVSFDTAAMRFDKRMNLVNEFIFTHEYSSAFTITDLNAYLKQRNVKEIIIIGLMAEDLVSESLLEGKESGYDMFVIPQALIAKSQKNMDKTIKKLKEKGIKIIDIKMLN